MTPPTPTPHKNENGRKGDQLWFCSIRWNVMMEMFTQDLMMLSASVSLLRFTWVGATHISSSDRERESPCGRLCGCQFCMTAWTYLATALHSNWCRCSPDSNLQGSDTCGLCSCPRREQSKTHAIKNGCSHDGVAMVFQSFEKSVLVVAILAFWNWMYLASSWSDCELHVDLPMMSVISCYQSSFVFL